MRRPDRPLTMEPLSDVDRLRLSSVIVFLRNRVDIARRIGVSHGVVKRAISGRPLQMAKRLRIERWLRGCHG